jgi:hypothetical protein
MDPFLVCPVPEKKLRFWQLKVTATIHGASVPPSGLCTRACNLGPVITVPFLCDLASSFAVSNFADNI